ncbi:MAG TPA: GNAT family N-acetyltransferase [Lysobacter sp.]|nr:GNAT family N-acetyltransferase [Lysobacter sp.]
MATDTITLHELRRAEAEEAEAVLVDAFADYAVMRYVLGDAPGYPERVRRLIGLFAAGRWLRGHPVLGARDGDGRLVAVAALTPPGEHLTPPELEALAEQTWGELGDDARARYAQLQAAWARGDAVAAAVPRWHLNMLGVLRAEHGRGHGARLLQTVQARAAADPVAHGVDLTTEHEPNLAFYARYGFAVVMEARVDPMLTTWRLVADHRAAADG